MCLRIKIKLKRTLMLPRKMKKHRNKKRRLKSKNRSKKLRRKNRPKKPIKPLNKRQKPPQSKSWKMRTKNGNMNLPRNWRRRRSRSTKTRKNLRARTNSKRINRTTKPLNQLKRMTTLI